MMLIWWILSHTIKCSENDRVDNKFQFIAIPERMRWYIQLRILFVVVTMYTEFGGLAGPLIDIAEGLVVLVRLNDLRDATWTSRMEIGAGAKHDPHFPGKRSLWKEKLYLKLQSQIKKVLPERAITDCLKP